MSFVDNLGSEQELTHIFGILPTHTAICRQFSRPKGADESPNTGDACIPISLRIPV